MVKFKDRTVKNPTHFMALCFTMMKQDPKFKDRNDILTQVLVHKDRALFACAHGFFWASQDRKYSSEFYTTKEEALTK
jgi:hypothetical protein